MKNKHDLTEGSIIIKLILVSLPVVATSFVQMAYNLTDLFWLGKYSDDAVASVGLAGLFIWLSAAIIVLVRIGTEVRVAQNTGRKDHESAKGYAKTGIQVELILAIIYATIIFVFAEPLLRMLSNNEAILGDSILYLRIIAFSLIFYLINPIFSAALNGTGNTFIPFVISAVGLVVNMILDPIFILGLDMGVRGAAIATVIAKFSVTIIFIVYSLYKNSIIAKINIFSKIDLKKAKDILYLGLPAAGQSAFFTFIAMYITGMIDQFDALHVNKVGQQIESFSWLVAIGLQTGLGAFVGQNYGAQLYDRVLKGIRYSHQAMLVYGVAISVLLFIYAEFVFGIFLDEPGNIALGKDYLRILAFSQYFMILESITGGAFNGLGKTIPQSIVSIIFNLARIPMAYLFIRYFELNGIWMAITISSILKGSIIYLWFKIHIRKNKVFKKIDLNPVLDAEKMNTNLVGG